MIRNYAVFVALLAIAGVRTAHAEIDVMLVNSTDKYLEFNMYQADGRHADDEVAPHAQKSEDVDSPVTYVVLEHEVPGRNSYIGTYMVPADMPVVTRIEAIEHNGVIGLEFNDDRWVEASNDDVGEPMDIDEDDDDLMEIDE